MYVLAHAFDASGTAVSGSPVECHHLAYGIYTNDSLIMPNTSHVKANYTVYKDSGFLRESDIHSEAIDVFYLEQDSASCGNLTGTIQNGETLTGTILGDNTPTGGVGC